MIFSLLQDLSDALAAMPAEHPRRRILKLLDEAIRRDVHFIERHPTTFFQCMWNTCWWYDCPEAAQHYEEPESGWKRPRPKQDALTTDSRAWVLAVCQNLGEQIDRLEGEALDRGYIPPWLADRPKLSHLLSRWREERESSETERPWIEALRPPPDPLDGGQISILRGHSAGVFSIASSPDDRLIASGGRDGSVRIWEVATSVERHALQGHADIVWSIKFSPDGATIGTAGCDGSARIWDVDSGRELFVMKAHGKQVFAIAFDPIVNEIATGGTDGSVAIWNREGRLSRCSAPQPGAVVAIEYLGSGQFAVARDGFGIELWDSTTLTMHRMISRESVSNIAVSPSGRILSLEYLLGIVQLFNPADEGGARTIRGQSGIMGGVAVSPDELWYAVGRQDGVVIVKAAQNGNEYELSGHTDAIQALIYLKDGRLVSASSDHTIRIWSFDPYKHRYYPFYRTCFNDHKNEISDLKVSSSGRVAVTASRNDHAVRVWELPSGKLAWRSDGVSPSNNIADQRLVALKAMPSCLAFSESGDRIAVGTLIGVRILDPSNWSSTLNSIADWFAVHCLAWLPNDLGIATAFENIIRIWLFDDPGNPTKLTCATGLVRRLGYAADGRLIAEDEHGNAMHISTRSKVNARRQMSCCSAEKNGLDMIIRSSECDRVIGWFPATSYLSPISSTATWAGTSGSHFRLFKLVGFSCAPLSDHSENLDAESNAPPNEYEAYRAIAELVSLNEPEQPDQPKWRRELSLSLSGSYVNLGDNAMEQGHLSKARDLYLQALDLAQASAKVSAFDTSRQRELLICFHKLGDVARVQGDLSEASRFFGESLRIAQRLAQTNENDFIAQRSLWVTYLRMADVLDKQGNAITQDYWRLAFDTLAKMKLTARNAEDDQHSLEITKRQVGSYPQVVVAQPEHSTLLEVRTASDVEQIEQPSTLATLPPPIERDSSEHNQTDGDTLIQVRNVPQHLKSRGGYSASRPHSEANADQAAQLNIEYQRQLAKWNALPIWKRWFTKPPERPTGI